MSLRWCRNFFKNFTKKCNFSLLLVNSIWLRNLRCKENTKLASCSYLNLHSEALKIFSTDYDVNVNIEIRFVDKKITVLHNRPLNFITDHIWSKYGNYQILVSNKQARSLFDRTIWNYLHVIILTEHNPLPHLKMLTVSTTNKKHDRLFLDYIWSLTIIFSLWWIKICIYQYWISNICLWIPFHFIWYAICK